MMEVSRTVQPLRYMWSVSCPGRFIPKKEPQLPSPRGKANGNEADFSSPSKSKIQKKFSLTTNPSCISKELCLIRTRCETIFMFKENNLFSESYYSKYCMKQLKEVWILIVINVIILYLKRMFIAAVQWRGNSVCSWWQEEIQEF